MKKIVVISGGSSGLGKAMAEALAPRYEVVILAPDRERLEAAAEELKCGFRVGDVSKNDEVESAVGSIISQFGRIDCLINNAGIWLEGELDENSADGVKKLFEVNALGTILLSRAVIPHMKKERKGLIINVVSQAGLYAKAGRSVYNASKWAVTGFTKCLQMDLAQYGIRVTGLYPGKMNTRLFAAAGVEKDMSDALDPQKAAKAVEFVLDTDDDVVIPEIGIQRIKQ